MSATPDSTLADSEQLIADLQRQLAECRAERDEGLQRETATAEVLQVINSSPGDLGPVFDAMLEKACRLCGAVQGALWLIDGERTRLAAARGLSADFVRLLRERGEATPTPPLQRVMRGERIVHYLDTEGSGLPFEAAAIDADVRTLIWVGLVREDTPLGAFAIARREVRAFSEKEIALLQNFAAQAVIALENARLVTETREALEQQTATAEVLGIINSSPGDLAPVFDAILEKAHSLCGAAHGDLTLEEGDNFRAVAMRGLPEAFCRGTAATLSPAGFPRAVVGRMRPHRRSSRRRVRVRQPRLSRSYRSRCCPHLARGAAPQGWPFARLHYGQSPGSAAVFRQTDRIARELRRPGGYRDGERAAADRDA